jgi:hypothetical protein
MRLESSLLLLWAMDMSRADGIVTRGSGGIDGSTSRRSGKRKFGSSSRCMKGRSEEGESTRGAGDGERGGLVIPCIASVQEP